MEKLFKLIATSLTTITKTTEDHRSELKEWREDLNRRDEIQDQNVKELYENLTTVLEKMVDRLDVMETIIKDLKASNQTKIQVANSEPDWSGIYATIAPVMTETKIEEPKPEPQTETKVEPQTETKVEPQTETKSESEVEEPKPKTEVRKLRRAIAIPQQTKPEVGVYEPVKETKPEPQTEPEDLDQDTERGFYIKGRYLELSSTMRRTIAMQYLCKCGKQDCARKPANLNWDACVELTSETEFVDYVAAVVNKIQK